MAEFLDSLTQEEVRKIIYREVPRLVRTDPEIRAFLERVISELGRERFADRQQTEDRFEKMLAELKSMREEFQEEMRRMREESERKWRELREESERKWQEAMEEIRRLREESERKWQEAMEEIRKLREESERKWQEAMEEIRKLREESERKWREYVEFKKESERRWEKLGEEIKALHRKYETGVGALGARWGLRAESSFREAIKGILEESFPVRVERYLARDEEGEVFGRPDQVELDLIIRDGEVIAAEIKSSMSKSDIYTFDRKVRFYEKREGRRVKRKLVVSPMVAPEALPVAEDLGIEVYTYPDHIEEL